jgi:hypothetical protein
MPFNFLAVIVAAFVTPIDGFYIVSSKSFWNNLDE